MLSDPATIARYCGKARKTRRGWKCRCPAHDDSDPSCEVWRGASAILVRCYSGCETRAVVNALVAAGFTMSERRSDGEKITRVKPVTQKGYALDDQPIDISRETLAYVARALKLWDEAVPLIGSAAENYLAGRGLSLDGIDVAQLRFHVKCPRGQQRHPAMLALMRDAVTGAPRAVHRTFIKRDGRRWIKHGKPMMFGPARGAAIMLTPLAETLAVCEGIETAFGLIADIPACRNVWALGSAGAIRVFQPLFGVRRLMIAADRDPAGRAGAWQARENWRESGWDEPLVIYWRDPLGRYGDDFADAAISHRAKQAPIDRFNARAAR